jgi:predicted RNase H-like HicB family nuclease
MKKIQFKNIVWKEGKYYVAQCLNIEVSSFGKTRKEAMKNLNEALELYFDDANGTDFIKVERPELITSSLRYA